MERNKTLGSAPDHSVFRRILTLPAAMFLAVSCATPPAAENPDDPSASFAKIKPVLERNCVHCHSSTRLPGMPSLTDTKALASLIGSANLIVPGKPEQSRFYTVVTLADNQAGAMPPTGHAISPQEAATLREWIRQGAMPPAESTKLHPRGTPPRSR